MKPRQMITKGRYFKHSTYDINFEHKYVIKAPYSRGYVFRRCVGLEAVLVFNGNVVIFL